ncbi:hypothetical protein LTR56_025038 [Elasticomyces elasticus]|nr:hypothetical protein LTR56_025038 [Elasticomyces elasticus]KAK5741569.1 hypothetical protein LTS12_024558 [Elasticomyces elasticus]
MKVNGGKTKGHSDSESITATMSGARSEGIMKAKASLKSKGGRKSKRRMESTGIAKTRGHPRSQGGMQSETNTEDDSYTHDRPPHHVNQITSGPGHQRYETNSRNAYCQMTSA